MTGPWSIEEARNACREASRQQQQTEKALHDASVRYAEAEEFYRKALATEILRQHAEDDVAWTAAADLARGEKNVARLRRERDIAKGVVDATTHAAWRRNADRKDAQRFADWSQRREFAEAFQPEEPSQ